LPVGKVSEVLVATSLNNETLYNVQVLRVKKM